MQLFSNKHSIPVRALLVGERIDLRSLEATQRLATAPLAVHAGANGLAVLFRYGAVVLFGLSPMEEVEFLKSLAPMISGAYTKSESEELTINMEPDKAEGVEVGGIILQSLGISRLQIVATILARSVALAFYEVSIAAVVEQVEPLALTMKTKGKTVSSGKKLLSYIGENLIIQHKMVGRVEVHEKPELLWENPDLERLYIRLEDEFELEERHTALDRKLDVISRTAETHLELLRHRSSLRVEWYITLLIMFEIGITLYKMWRP